MATPTLERPKRPPGVRVVAKDIATGKSKTMTVYGGRLADVVSKLAQTFKPSSPTK